MENCINCEFLNKVERFYICKKWYEFIGSMEIKIPHYNYCECFEKKEIKDE